MSDELTWYKSSYSGTGGGNCVQVAVCPDTVHVRDSKDVAGPRLAFASSAWAAFVAGCGRASA